MEGVFGKTKKHIRSEITDVLSLYRCAACVLLEGERIAVDSRLKAEGTGLGHAIVDFDPSDVEAEGGGVTGGRADHGRGEGRGDRLASRDEEGFVHRDVGGGAIGQGTATDPDSVDEFVIDGHPHPARVPATVGEISPVDPVREAGDEHIMAVWVVGPKVEGQDVARLSRDLVGGGVVEGDGHGVAHDDFSVPGVDEELAGGLFVFDLGARDLFCFLIVRVDRHARDLLDLVVTVGVVVLNDVVGLAGLVSGGLLGAGGKGEAEGDEGEGVEGTHRGLLFFGFWHWTREKKNRAISVTMR